jgi:hypothetical protein
MSERGEGQDAAEIMAHLSQAAATTSEDIVEAIVGDDDYAKSPFVLRSAEGGTIFRGVNGGDNGSEGSSEASSVEEAPVRDPSPAPSSKQSTPDDQR